MSSSNVILTQGKIHSEIFFVILKEFRWHEHDPLEIITSIEDCIEGAVKTFETQGHSARSIKAVGITNQRETTVVWDNETGEPLYNAIVWTDTRHQRWGRKRRSRRFTRGAPCLSPCEYTDGGNWMHEAYQPVIEDGRGIFPEDFRIRAPLGLKEAVRVAAKRQHMTRAEYARRALLRSIEADGVTLRRGAVATAFHAACRRSAGQSQDAPR